MVLCSNYKKQYIPAFCKLPSTSCSIVSEFSWTLPSQGFYCLFRSNFDISGSFFCLSHPAFAIPRVSKRTTMKLGGYIVRIKMFLLTYVTRHDDFISSRNYIIISEHRHLGSAILDPPSWIRNLRFLDFSTDAIKPPKTKHMLFLGYSRK